MKNQPSATSLAAQYRMTDENLMLRKQLLGFGPSDVATLRSLNSWAKRVAPAMVRDMYDKQFAHPSTRAFFEDQARQKGLSLDKLRGHLEKMQAGYFTGIFEEAANGGRFGVDYFERRLFVGKLHNQINLPLKWYVGSYGLYMDLVRKYLRRSYMLRPDIISRAERSIFLIFNYDMQAVSDAFFYDYLQSVGLDLTNIRVDRTDEDLSDHYVELKATVRDALVGAAQASDVVVEIADHLKSASAQSGEAIRQVAGAMQAIAAGAADSSMNAQTSSEAMRQLQEAIDSIARGPASRRSRSRAPRR